MVSRFDELLMPGDDKGHGTATGIPLALVAR
jgi:hypothetical protein